MKNFILGLSLLLGLLFPTAVLADSYSQGEVNYSVLIDKKIRPIDDNKYYDNIGKDQKIFVTGDVMDFSILVENTGKDILRDLIVKDFYPVVNQIILGPGEIDKLNRQITWKIDTLAVGETRNYTIRAKVATDSSSMSQTNVVQVSNNNVYDKDTATFFVNKKTTPSTGSNDLFIKSGLTMIMSLAALGLRKIARGY
ncbi:hypothetical protein KBB48_00755 [Candidatus Shapirobacteria bacterium]|nr:hypothetical protein [Candidatus Shapirobacteria bacterium]